MIQSIKSSSAGISQQLQQKLTDSGARSTQTRTAILGALASRADGFTVEELCRDVHPIGRATVYRTVGLLVKEGLICKLAMGDNKPRYSLARPGHHHHAVCVGCGSIDDFRGCDIDDLVQSVSKAAGSQAIGHRLEVYVLCAKCNTEPERKKRSVRASSQHKHI